MVSLNLCTDELLLRLAPRDQIASVTWLGKDNRRSGVAALAKDVLANRGLAEEIVTLKPDLVLAGAHDARPAVTFLKRHGTHVLDLAIPQNLSEVRDQIRDVASALGRSDTGEDIIARMDAKLAAAAPPSSARPRAIMLGPNGFATGYSPLMNEVFARAGLDNLAGELGAPERTHIPVERVLLADVDIVVTEDAERGPALAQEMMRHPAIAALREQAIVVELPSRLWTCAGPQLADAVEILARARAEHGAK